MLCLLFAGTVSYGRQPIRSPEYVFRFVPGSDVFYVPWNGNGGELNRLLEVLGKHRGALDAGKMYVQVSNYAASGSATLTALRMAYMRNSRVKSELIVRAGITEGMFVTDRLIPEAYEDSLRNVVVVTFPASLEKVAEIAGPEAAVRVETYNKEVFGDSEASRRAAEQAERERRARENESAAREQARLAAEQAAQEQAEQARLIAEQQARERAKAERLAAEAAATARPYRFALRTNLLRWATLTPDIGIEWRISRSVGVAADAAWIYWSWSGGDRRYSLLHLSPEVRWYLGSAKRGYVGAMFQAGNFNYKFSETGRQGNFYGGGVTGGYQLPVGRRLMLDFGAGIGYTRADSEKYRRLGGYDVRNGREIRNYFGLNRLTVRLVWTFGSGK